MRWPWQREHPRDTPPPAPADAAVQRAAEPSPMGWAFLPPLQRSIASPDLITRPAQFPHTLPAWRDPSFSSHDLSHVVSPAAPSGVIDGDGVGAPVQRSAHPDLPLLLSATPTRPVVQRSVPDSPVAAPAPTPQRSYTRTSTEHLPVLQLAAVEPAPAPEPEPQVETAVEEAPEQTPEAAEVHTADDGHEHGGATGQVNDLPGLEADPSTGGPDTEASTAPTLGASGAPSATSVQRNAEPTAPAAPPAPEPRRRYGLGAPLAAVPPSSTTVQRHGDSSSTPPMTATSGVQPPTTTTATTATDDPTAPPATPETGSLPDRPTLQRATTPTTLAVGPVLSHGPGVEARRGCTSTSETALQRSGADLPVVPVEPQRPGLEARSAGTSTSETALQRSGAHLPVASPVPGLEARSLRTSTSGTASYREEHEAPRAAASSDHGDEAPLQRAVDTVDVTADQGPVVAAEGPEAPAPSELPLAVTASEPEAADAETVSADPPSAEAPDLPPAPDTQPSTAPVLSAGAPVQRSAGTVEQPTTRPLLGGPGVAPTLLAPSSTAPTPVSAVGPPTGRSTTSADSTVTVSRSTAAAPVVIGRTVPSPARTPSGASSRLSGDRAIPTVSRALGMPSMPSMPSLPTTIPAMPALPSLPSMPSVPDVPTDLPSMPAVPTKPTAPALPALPATPGMPDVPGMATAPGSLLPVPPMPTLPLAPTGGSTTETAASQAPVTPTEPVLDARSTGGATEVPIGGGSGSTPGDATAATSAPTGGAAATGAGAHGGSSDDMEALAQKLLSPMLRRIKAELLLDRERRGLRTDTW